MIKVAILFGGTGKEHEVSISSAKNILENIDKNKFDVLEVFITKDKKYKIGDDIFDEEEGIREIKNRGAEVILPIIHGEYGEDGQLQYQLEKADIKFVGHSSVVSSLTIDKNKTNEILSKSNIKIPESKIVSKGNQEIDLNYPIIIKPINEGSSVDLFKFVSMEDYKKATSDVFMDHTEMLAQEFVSGREFTCGVIEINKKATPLVVSEVILTKGDLFDYDAKYKVGGCKEVTPAEVDDVLRERIKNLALTCHHILGCKSMSRTDMILKGDELYVLEINTVPGMTKTSFVPQQAKACGYEMKELITVLIESVI